VKYYIFFSFFLLLFSCGSSEVSEKKANQDVVISPDSISKILKEIHASEKAYQLDTLFKNKVKQAGFNGCVLIAQRGQIIYERAFGYADLKKKDSLKINSAFQLASTSKTLTAAAILLLRDQGKLKLTDSIQKFFPDFPYPHITLKLLLSHRSGLGNYLYFCEPYCDKNNCYNGKVFDNNSFLHIMLSSKPPVYALPNKKFEYCNTNYALLACIIEKVSGLSYPDFMEQNIFKPLGMKDTWVHCPKYDSLHTNKTAGHNGLGNYEKDTFADDVYGDKGIYSTVEDLFKWDQALYSEKLLNNKTKEEAFTGYSNEHKGKRNYGYGWRITDNGKGNKVIYHNGWWHGYNTLFFRRPSDQTTIVILSNKYNHSTYQIKGVLTILNNNSEAIELDGAE
jgi:CubicO group peptidase (beta-lactamase class C family)